MVSFAAAVRGYGRLTTFLVASVLFSGCGEHAQEQPLHVDVPGDKPSAEPRVTRVVISSNSENSAEELSRFQTSVVQGTRVVWVNADSRDHTITSPIGLWDSGRLKPGHSFSRTFEEPGNFDFLSVMDSKVIGRVQVQAPPEE
ncbi:MAG: hypothetical protein A2X94_08690 [Bdellovibrionales bacterium GWB1_55_8]|nr:MAG: hypothetical protein A2X94_08690 [Bdellovibrionales bacterium GWB1_55_8]